MPCNQGHFNIEKMCGLLGPFGFAGLHRLAFLDREHMINRFLGWNLPENFRPDGGISFARYGNEGTDNQFTRRPVGTNLLDATQAEAMVRHMLDGLPE
jgi:hypothetical protein